MKRVAENRPGRRLSIVRNLVCAATLMPLAAAADFTLRMQTDLGALDIELFDTVAPGTVANFMNYVNRGADDGYDGTFIHRSVPGFVVQGGGYVFDPADGNLLSGGATHIPTDPPIPNEFSLSNTRGTLAMAKLGGDPDSATSEWFFNVADNSDPLNTDNGGYTVFGQVLGNGMDVIDAINALATCGLFFCVPWDETPFADPNYPTDEDNLILLNVIGADGERDGAIDSLENLAPSPTFIGDGNGDNTLDSLQQHVASVPAGSAGQYIVLESIPAYPLRSFSSVGTTFRIANPPSPTSLFTGISFNQGHVSYEVLNVTPGGDATVVLTLPAGEVPDTFYNYGPTQLCPAPHWYEFLYDGTTGAEFNGNVVTLHFRDGERGDADGFGNGVIVAPPGGPTNKAPDQDGDGVHDAIEDAAPNSGDGNNDGTPDSQQGDVASYQDVSGAYVTLQALPSVLSPAPLLRNVLPEEGECYLQAADPSSLVEGKVFEHGFVGFRVIDVEPGDSIDVRMILPEGEQPDTYFQFGVTPTNLADHLYEFLFDAASGTGAVIDANVVTLNYVDGDRGDGDLAADGEILASPGGPAVTVDADADGVLDTVEDAGPNGGDANGDGDLDSVQGNVVSFPDIRGNYVLLETALPVTVHKVESLVGNEFDSLLGGTTLGPPELAGHNFTNGFFSAEIRNVVPGGSTQLLLTLPTGGTADTYFMYGPEPGDATPHWYEFLYDGTTGAEFNGNVVTLHFVDGLRGDSDLTVNGIVSDPGGPALRIGNTNAPSGGGGGGCSLSAQSRNPAAAGHWWLVLGLVGVLGAWRGARRTAG